MVKHLIENIIRLRYGNVSAPNIRFALMTNAAVARLLGVSDRTVSRYSKMYRDSLTPKDTWLDMINKRR